MSNDKLSSVIRDYLAVDAEIKAQQLVAEELRNQIKDEMTARGVEELEIDSHIVRYRDVLSNIFCTSKLKEKYPELYMAFLRQIPSKKFSIA